MTPPVPPLPSRSLNDWYLTVNRIYLDRNFHRSEFAIFAHLVEIVGGLSLLASSKSKPTVEAAAFIPKALAWWMALCGKVGVHDVGDLLWLKFPGVCPYCFENPHSEPDCKKGVGPHHLDWVTLARHAKERKGSRPRTIGDWQRMFFEIYRVGSTEDYLITFARFSEELGELAEALRVASVAPGYFISEAADVFAWLMHLQNLVEVKGEIGTKALGQALDRHFAESYPDVCGDCESAVCRCPPVLPSTLGRIAHEVPPAALPIAGARVLIPVEEVMQLFNFGSMKVTIAGNDFRVTTELLREIRALVAAMQTEVTRQGQIVKVSGLDVAHLLTRMDDVLATQRITNENIDEIRQIVDALPSPSRQAVMSVLANLAAAPWAAALLRVLS